MIALAVIGATAVAAWASGDWGSAQDAVADMKKQQQELRKLAPEETQEIVTAICKADDDTRREAGERAAERVAKDVTSKFEDLRHSRDYAYRLLDDVLADESAKDHWDDAKQLRSEIEKRWDSITNMAELAMKGANHPLVSYLINEGKDAHREAEEHCNASEFTLNSGKRVDCLMAGGETCMVIEFKPDNSTAVGNGLKQAKDYAKELNEALHEKDSSVIEKLVKSNAAFGKCKEFTYQVDCYTLCPRVDDEGKFQEGHPVWRRDCS